MSRSYAYNPVPTRVWSRVQNRCTFVDSSNNSYYQSVFIPLPAIPFTQQPMPLAEANYQDRLLYKGNILQYKGNSSRLTKKQQYTQLAKGFGPNRTKVFATQTQTYTNPNTTGLQRVNYTTYPSPNTLVGKPNNISGPFQYDVPNPNGCLNLDGTPSTSLQDGGSLVCGTLANPCTGELIKSNNGSAAICNPASASDVPGTSFLCWNKQLQTWFPRQRYIMPNSGTKWPEGYKGFVSAVVPEAPILTLDSFTNTTASISWVDASGVCLAISSYRIYLNDQLYTTLPYPIRSYTLYNLSGCPNNIYVTSVLSGTESDASNVVTVVLVVVPEAPILTVGTSSCDVVLNWGIVGNPCIPISSYNIYQDSIFIKSVPHPVASTTINNLNFASSYSFSVTSLSNNNIQSVPSNVATTVAVAPPAPILTVGISSCDVVLNWTIVSSPCIPISSYNIYQDSIFIKSVSYPVASTTINNLILNSSYSFYVTSLSNNIQSAPSNVATTVAVAPAAPILTVGISSCDVVLNWSIVSSPCVPISSYNIYQDSIFIKSVSYPLASTTINNLNLISSYSFYVTSLSNNIQSVPSNVATTVAVVPEAPILTLDSYTNTTASISWVDAVGVCLTISSYRVYLNNQLYTTVSYPNHSYTLNNLSACSNNIYVTSVVSGTESVGSNVVTSCRTPDAPSNVTGYFVSSSSALLNWTAPPVTASTCIATSYNVYYGTDNITFTKINVGNVLTSTITGLTTTQYYVYVTAQNNCGEGPASSHALVLPNPAPPQNLQPYTGQWRYFSVSWQSPAYSGSSPFSHYTLLIKNNFSPYAVFYQSTNYPTNDFDSGTVTPMVEGIFNVYLTAVNTDGYASTVVQCQVFSQGP